MADITPFLWFDNCALAAAKYYCGIFKNSSIQEISYKGDQKEDIDSNILTVSFMLAGRNFVGLNGGDVFKFNEAVSFSIACKNQEEIDYYWGKLTLDGEEVQCGWLKDKYGLSWQVVPENMGKLLYDPDPIKAKRKMEKMLAMKKINMQELATV